MRVDARVHAYARRRAPRHETVSTCSRSNFVSLNGAMIVTTRHVRGSSSSWIEGLSSVRLRKSIFENPGVTFFRFWVWRFVLLRFVYKALHTIDYKNWMINFNFIKFIKKELFMQIYWQFSYYLWIRIFDLILLSNCCTEDCGELKFMFPKFF